MNEELMVLKRDGSKEKFSLNKLAFSIAIANESINKSTRLDSLEIALHIIKRAESKAKRTGKNEISSEELEIMTICQLVNDGKRGVASNYECESAYKRKDEQSKIT